MTGGEAYKAKLLTEDALNDAVAAYLADPSKLVALANLGPSFRCSGNARGGRISRRVERDDTHG